MFARQMMFCASVYMATVSLATISLNVFACFTCIQRAAMMFCIKHTEMAIKLCQQQHKHRRWFYLIISRKSVGHMMGLVELLTIEFL